VRRTASLLLWLCAAWAAEVTPSIEEMALPIEGVKKAEIRDMFTETHNGHMHEAIDIMAPTGTPIRAVVPGTIKKLFLSKAGGITIYQFDEQQVYCYYYAHLERYADGLHEGMHVDRGDLIGFVGSTGNASPDAPHLHFTVFELGPEKQWWKGTAINPYAGLLAALARQEQR